MIWNKKRSRKKGYSEIEPDEIFLDSSNLPHFDMDQFEGRLEKPISRRTTAVLLGFFILIIIVYAGRIWNLEVQKGDEYLTRSKNNSLKNSLIFASRGVIDDRNDIPLAWNEFPPEGSDFALRKYSDAAGLSGLLGYLKYPLKDKSNNYYSLEYDGKDGVEKYFDEMLAGQNGLKITETDALGKVQSESVIRPPKNGDNLVLSIDSKLQSELYRAISTNAHTSKFLGGAGVIMDVHTGEIMAMATFPEYDSQVMTDGKDAAAINGYLNNKNNPFLNRVVGGLYTPGSIVKPYMALAALQEHIITPEKQMSTIGYISVPNPYDAQHPSIFKDWQNQGVLDMRKAIAESSDVYFYEVGGGYQDQKGLGIDRIEKYIRTFGFGESFTGIFAGPKGVIPDPAWKKENFDGEDWRIGDTYHTAIGQYGFQVTPLQAVRAVASIANDGILLQPTLIFDDPRESSTLRHNTAINASYYHVVQEGMRQGVLSGVATAVNVPGVEVAAKTGTAQLGFHNEFVNSWITGYFPYNNPKYAFALVMEKGPVKYPLGAPGVMGQVLQWMVANTPEYVN
jgi:penicillin-binding protein 2